MNGYKVTDSREISGMTQAGGEHNFTRVWIQTDKGATGHVDVEPEDWNTEVLKEILTAKAERLDLAFEL